MMGEIFLRDQNLLAEIRSTINYWDPTQCYSNVLTKRAGTLAELYDSLPWDLQEILADEDCQAYFQSFVSYANNSTLHHY